MHYESNDYLAHYGVKGMKWGVRRAQKKQAKQQDRREKYLYKTQRKINRNNASANQARKNLKELKKNGENSEMVETRARNKAQIEVGNDVYKYEKRTGKKVDQSVADLGGSLKYRIFQTEYKKQAYKELVDENNELVRHHVSQAKRWAAANEAVMNMPVESSNRDYRKAIRKAKKYANV